MADLFDHLDDLPQVQLKKTTKSKSKMKEPKMEFTDLQVKTYGLKELNKQWDEFRKYDLDKSGTIDMVEFKKMVYQRNNFKGIKSGRKQSSGEGMDEVIDAAGVMIAGEDGVIDFKEFLGAFAKPLK